MLGDQVLEVGGVKYPLRLSFAAVKDIETKVGKSLIHLDAISFYEMSVALAACAGIDEEKAFELIKEVGMDVVAVKVKTLIVETFNPSKKSAQAAKKPKN